MSRRSWLVGLLVLVLIVGVAAARVAAAPKGLPYPSGCGEYGMSQRRCDAVVAWARDQLGPVHLPIVRTDLLPDPCRPADGRVLCMRGVGFVARVGFVMADGSTATFEPYCMPPSGVGGLVCGESPTVTAIDLHVRGYWDVPCSGEPPAGCATPLVPDVAAVAAARPLEIPSLDVPVGEVGHHEVNVGQAVLANGIVREGTFRLATETQEGFLLDPGTVTLKLRSTDPSRPPFDNVHTRGRFAGTETVSVLLVFDVIKTSPGAVLQVRGLVVR